MTFVYLTLSAFLLFEAIYTLRHAIRFHGFFIDAHENSGGCLRPVAPASRRQVSSSKHIFAAGDAGPTDCFQTDSRARPCKVALLAPCKGIDQGIHDNILSWLQQDYPDFKIFFIVESSEDPVIPILQKFSPAKILIAGRAVDAGQKVHNLRFAIETLSEEFEIFAFVDSDCRVEPDWLSSLVTGINRNPEGAVTGYRWFDTPCWHFPTNLRSVWNSSVLTLFERSGRWNFAWGGSMAISRKTFFDARVGDFWKGSISDDYGLTNAMRKGKRRILFIPRAIVLTEERIGLLEFLSWASRQLLITKIYNRLLWRLAFVYHTVWVFWLILGIASFPKSLLLMFLFTQISQVIKAELRLDCIRSVFGRRARVHRLYYWLLSPVVSLANFFMLLKTLLSNQMDWRGINYKLKGPNALEMRDTGILR